MPIRKLFFQRYFPSRGNASLCVYLDWPKNTFFDDFYTLPAGGFLLFSEPFKSLSKPFKKRGKIPPAYNERAREARAASSSGMGTSSSTLAS